MTAQQSSAFKWALTGIVFVGLVVDSIVHFDLATNFSHIRTSTLSMADIFRIEAAVALLVALALLVRPRRYTAVVAFFVAASAAVAVLVYRYINVGSIGPVPNMYDPYWQPAGKWISAIAEVVAAVAAAGLFALMHVNSAKHSAVASGPVTQHANSAGRLAG